MLRPPLIDILWPEFDEDGDEGLRGFSSMDSIPTADGGIITKMPVAKTRALPVVEAASAIRDKYAEKLSDSDLWCLISMVESGHLEVLRDKGTRNILIAATGDAEKFIDSVFGITPDELVPA